MKKQLCALLAAGLALSLTSCGISAFDDPDAGIDGPYGHLPRMELVAADTAGKDSAGQLFGELVAEKISESTQGRLTIDVSAVLVILYLGFFGSGVAQFTWVKSLSMLPASTCSLFYPLQPVFAAVLGALILGERFTPAFFLGLALISADVALSTWETKKLSGS